MSRPVARQNLSSRTPKRSPRTAGLLVELSDRLRAEAAAENYVLCAKLESLCNRIGELSAPERREFDRNASPLRPALLALIDGTRSDFGAAAVQRDLRTLLRSLRCMADRIADPEL